MSELDSTYVKRGIWTNWDRGSIMGKTITVDTRTGSVVIALLALLSTIGTAHLWHLVTFFFHQFRANGLPSDVLFRQQQAILRTLPSPSTLTAELVKLWWAWRKNGERIFVRSLLQMLLAILFSIATVATSILSSYIVTTANLEVLVESPSCGFVNISRLDQAHGGDNAYWSKVKSTAFQYSLDCYQEGKPEPAKCNVFTKPKVPQMVTHEAVCPFSPLMCVEGNTSAVDVDSGLLDLNTHFGLNLSPRDRVKFRRKISCAVLPVEGYYRNVSAGKSHGIPGERYFYLDYGTEHGGESKDIIAFSSLGTQLLSSYSGTSLTSYASPRWMNETSSLADRFQFDPLPSMERQDADIALIAINAGVVHYRNPVEDPLFSAHQVLQDPDENMTWYTQDWPARALGCTEQYQFCIARSSGNDFCSPLGPHMLNVLSDDFPEATDTQIAVIKLMLAATTLANQAEKPVRSNATETLYGGRSRGLPDNQWIIEVLHIDSFVWSALQTMVSDYAVGPAVRASDIQESVDEPMAGGQRDLCRAQKMRKAGGFANISFFGLTFVVTSSILLAILDFTILRFLIFLSRFRRALAPRIDRWVQDGVFQLQRRAYEAQGQGGWTDLEKEVPLNTHDRLDDLPVESLSRCVRRRECYHDMGSVNRTETCETLANSETNSWEIRTKMVDDKSA